MNLIPAVIGIGLLALTIGAGITYVNPGAQAAAETTAVVTAGFQSLAQAYQSRQMTGAPPPDPASWESALFPAYGFEPRPPTGGSWSYGVSAAGRWFCLSFAKAGGPTRAALASVGKRYSAVSYQISGACGDATASSTTGDAVSATLWVSREGS